MPQRPGTVLVVDDDQKQRSAFTYFLRGNGLEVRDAANGAEALQLAQSWHPDLVLLDVVMPGLDGYEVCRRLKESPDHPLVLMVSGIGTRSEDRVLGLEAGADGYLVKPVEPAELVAQARALLRVRRAEATLARDALLLASVRDSVIVTDLNGVVTYWNEGATRLFGWTAQEMVGRPLTDRVPEAARPAMAGAMEAIRDGQEFAGEWEDYRKDGSRVWIDARVSRILDAAGRPVGFLRLAHDISDRKRGEEERQKLIALIEHSPDFIGHAGPGQEVHYVNRAGQQLVGIRSVEVSRTAVLDYFPHEERERVRGEIWPALLGQRRWHGEVLFRHFQTGEAIPVLWDVFILPVAREGESPSFACIARDLREGKRLEEQLRQAQKMEAVGRLAGGVAHDFNNLLTIINGYSDLVLQELPAGHPARSLLGEIRQAGERSASLTRQLLAFSRKQVVAPKALDLNALVVDAEKLLRRLIGEDIALTTSLAPGLGHVRADPGQMEQVVFNLVVNARDAMPHGGKLTIATADAKLSHEYAELRPGPYVLLSVSDTGCGMPPEVQAHIFEPFFTTKEAGKGTGLGLSTVYGIVKQAGGHVAVYSEPGVGTSLKVYLPRVEQADQERPAHTGLTAAPRGTETILLVEDDDGVRALSRHVLRGSGYIVLEASDGDDALRVAARHEGQFHLLVTDVVMPELGGRQLAERLLALRPGLKVLYLSGYTEDAVVRHGVLEETVHFLQKPFTPLALARKVREVLDATPRSGGGEMPT